MGRSSSTWQRVSRRRPCPVCGKPDWCVYAGEPNDPEAVICARTESQKRCGESGWLHILRHDGPTWSPRVRRIELSAARIALPPGPTPRGRGDTDFDRMASRYLTGLKKGLDKLAISLGLSMQSLERLGVGWSNDHKAWTFPMRNAAGDVLGIRLRLSDGKKLSVRGGREGLFIPSPHPNPLPRGEETGLPGPLPTDHSSLATLLVAEGPTDTAALLDLGFDAVGRPSCAGGVKLMVELVRQQKPSAVVIVADGDPPGQCGAESLAVVLVAYASVRIITPPVGVKDAREWLRSGATAADVQSVIDAAVVRKLAIASTIRGKAGGRHG